MEKDITILVAYHREDEVIRVPGFQPLQVGRALAANRLAMPGDDTGENISTKNGVYCELTALHWAGGNLRSDFVGLCHYRRYFTFRGSRMWRLRAAASRVRARIRKAVDLGHESFIWEQTIVASMADVEALEREFLRDLAAREWDGVFLAPLELGCSTVRDFFSRKTGSDVLASLEDAVGKKAPEMLGHYRALLAGNRFSPCNMLVLRRDRFAEYHRFAFSVLDEVEATYGQGMDPRNPAPPYRRLLGYLGELLTATFALGMEASSDVVLHANIVQFQRR